MTILTSRRRFLAGLFCAPAIIPAAKLMAVRPWVDPAPDLFSLMKERMRASEISRMVNPPVGFDAAGNVYELFTTYFRWERQTGQLESADFSWKAVLCRDPRYVARIANVEDDNGHC